MASFDTSIEDLREIYRLFDQQMSAMLRVSGAASADDVVDALLTAVLRFASALILRHPNRRELLQVLPERLDQYIAEIKALRRKAGYPDD
jgi:cell division protein ZapA (FtsZ GTPase activity inhibitor)